MTDALSEWLCTPIGQACEYYTSLGWYIFPVHGIVDGKCTCGKFPCGENNKQSGKHPATLRGFKDANNEIKDVAELFSYRPNFNIGVATGASGFFILDIDFKNSGDFSIEELIRQHGELPHTRASTTGNGCHIFFKMPDFEVKNSANGLRGFPGLDIRGTGGYIVLPPSKHFSGKQYQFPEGSPEVILPAPEWLLKLIQVKKEEKVVPLQQPAGSTGGHSEWSVEEVHNMLDCLDPDIGYDEWLRVGMALHQGGFALSMWDGWSSAGRKYVANECTLKWRGFNANDGVTMGTLYEAATVRGWKPKVKDRPIVDTAPVAPLMEKIRAKNEEKKKTTPKKVEIPLARTQGLPWDPMTLPGLIGDTVRWITKYALHKHPELAMLNTLAFAGAVFGRRYASPINTRTNIYAIGTGDTAIGKDHSRKMITRLAHAADLGNVIGANAIRSDTGMLRSLMVNSSQMMMLDEIGQVLKAVADARAPYHIQMISRALLTLYSDSSSIYNHGDYADPKAAPIVIHSPNLCIYGTDTEASYIPALKKTSIENGQLNRFIIIPATRKRVYPDKNAPHFEIDEDLAQKWGAFSKMHAMGNLGALVNSAHIVPEPIIVGWGDCKDVAYEISCFQIDRLNEESNSVRALWGRYYENVMKIAMMFAIARNKETPVFIGDDFKLAIDIVKCSINYLMDIASNHMTETVHEELHVRIIKAMQEKNGKITRSELLRKFRSVKKREMDDILIGMMEQEVIVSDKISTGESAGRPKTVYYLPQDNGESEAVA